jgi:nicotinate-nucleotide adenylyltransferase
MRIAFYGGSFNPPHVGHQLTLAYVLSTQNVDEVWVAPVFNHPDGKQLVDFDHRLAMCQHMVSMFDNNRVVVKDTEKEVYEQFGSGLTINTVRYLLNRPKLDGHQLLLILGYDILPSFERWQGYEELAKLRSAGKLDFFFVGRTGHGHSPVEMPRISSTEIRQMLLSSGEMNDGMLAGMLPSGVRKYIRSTRLYR